MSDEPTRDWAQIHTALIAPFDPAEVDIRPQGSLAEDGKGRAVAYLDARAVQDRLDAAVGAENWSFTWDALIQGKDLQVVRGMLTIFGVVKSDVGDSGGGIEPNKSAVSDCLKRCAVMWGVGRYLYGLQLGRVAGQGTGEKWTIKAEEYARLRAKLPRPAGMAAESQPPGQHADQARHAAAQAQDPDITAAKKSAWATLAPYYGSDAALIAAVNAILHGYAPGTTVKTATLTQWQRLAAEVAAGKHLPAPATS